MTFSVLQKNLEPPAMEQLRAAFGNVPGLTALDASTQGRYALGMLGRSFEREQADALQAALAAQGVETEVVEDGSLPALPESRMVHRLECTPDAVMIYDPLGRSFPLKWEYVILIAAGQVRMSDFITQEVLEPAVTHPRYAPMMEYQKESKEVQNDHWLLEIVITDAKFRYSVVADNPGSLLFQYLGERRTHNLATDFKLLVQDLAGNAPQAAINRGAYYLRENSAEPFHYPGKKSFYEEIIWLLWKMK